MTFKIKNNNHILLAQFSGQHSILTIPTIYYRLTKCLNKALLLNQIIFYSNKSTMHEDGWFHKCYSEWGEELFLTERTLRAYFNEFVNLGYIETRIMKIKGVRTLLLRPLMDKISDALFTIIETLNTNNNDQKLPQPERIAVSKLYESCPNRKNLPDSQPEKFAVSNTIYTDKKDQIIKHTHVSDETSNLSYNNFEKKDEKEKSDYKNNHDDHPEIEVQLVEPEGNYTKSDYCEYQTNKKTDSKIKVRFTINDMLNDNPHNIPEQSIRDWIVTRGKHLITKTAWNLINNQLKKCVEEGIEPIDAFDTMVASNWRSLKVEYFISKEKILKKEEAKRRSIELEEMAAKRKQKEIDDAKRINRIPSQVSVVARGQLRAMTGARNPGEILSQTFRM